jgi:hypothetical protein
MPCVSVSPGNLRSLQLWPFFIIPDSSSFSSSGGIFVPEKPLYRKTVRNILSLAIGYVGIGYIMKVERPWVWMRTGQKRNSGGNWGNYA